MLPDISDFIIELGNTLSKKDYDMPEGKMCGFLKLLILQKQHILKDL